MPAQCRVQGKGTLQHANEEQRTHFGQVDSHQLYFKTLDIFEELGDSVGSAGISLYKISRQNHLLSEAHISLLEIEAV